MDEDENIIRANLPSLLSACELRARAGTGGEWKLHEIHYIHAMPKNIEFSLILESGPDQVRVSAKINRKTQRLSDIKVAEC